MPPASLIFSRFLANGVSFTADTSRLLPLPSLPKPRLPPKPPELPVMLGVAPGMGTEENCPVGAFTSGAVRGLTKESGFLKRPSASETGIMPPAENLVRILLGDYSILIIHRSIILFCLSLHYRRFAVSVHLQGEHPACPHHQTEVSVRTDSHP